MLFLLVLIYVVVELVGFKYKRRYHMHITNNIQSKPSTSFGMALKIKPAAKKFLVKENLSTIKKISKYGEELNKIKYFDLILDANHEGLVPIIEQKATKVTESQSIYPTYEAFNEDSWVFIGHALINDRQRHIKYFAGNFPNGNYKMEMSSKSVAKSVVQKIDNAKTELDKAVEIIKAAEDSINARIKEQNQNQDKEKIEAEVNQLFSKYGE